MGKNTKVEYLNKKVTVTGEFLEQLNNPVDPKSKAFESLLQRTCFPVRLLYWLGRLQEKLQQEARVYFRRRQELLRKNADVWEEDGEGHRKGDIKTNPDGSVVWKEGIDGVEVLRMMEELRYEPIEIELKKLRVPLECLDVQGKDDKPLSPAEFAVLGQLVEIVEEEGEE